MQLNELDNKFSYFLLVTAVQALFALTISAQPLANCPDPTGYAHLDNGFTRAKVNVGNRLFYDGVSPLYELPSGSGIHPVFMGALWLGGMVDGELRVTASRYEGTELWPGPSDAASDCSTYDRIYSISREDIQRFETRGVETKDLRYWPTGVGAPTYDRHGKLVDLSELPFDNRKERLIDLEAGERPAIRGHHSLWWIMNDLGNEHLISQSQPLGVEIHALGYSAVTGSHAVDYATVFNFRIFNRNDSPISDAYIAMFFDVDLGDFDDDLFGSDSSRGMGFIYNWDNEDDGPSGYGIAPPALGALFLEGPVALADGRDNDKDGEIDEQGERLGTTAIGRHYNGGGVTEDPTEAVHFYNYMRARWKDGLPFTVGMRNHSTEPTNYLFPGDPVTRQYWSELSYYGCTSTCYPPGDRNMFISSGPFNLDSASDTDVTIAIVWARGITNIDSITELRNASELLLDAFKAEYFVNAPSFFNDFPNEPRLLQNASLSHNFPDPFSESSSIQYRVSDRTGVKLLVFDILGRPVETLVDEVKDEGVYTTVFDGKAYPSGVYFYRIQIGHATATRSMMLVK